MAASVLLPLAGAAAAANFSISVSAPSVPMGGSVVVTADASGFTPSAAGVVLWPFVNGSQWGAFVTCRVAGSTDGCSLVLPLPVPGGAAVQLAVLPGGRDWCQNASGCMFPVGTPLPAAVTALSDTARVSVGAAAPPAPPASPTVCADWEPWFTRHNLGGSPWLRRPGAEGVPLVGLYSSFSGLVVRQHALWMAAAGVNCIMVDWSNNLWSGTPWPARAGFVQELINATAFAAERYAELRAEGVPTPRIMVMIGRSNGPGPATLSALADEAKWIKDNIVDQYGAENYVLLDGRPALPVLHTAARSAPPQSDADAISTDFAVRWMGTQLQDRPQLGAAGFWSWMDGALSPVPAVRPDGSVEALTVTPAFFNQGGWLSATAAPQRNGSTFVATMQTAVRLRPKVLLVCQWNEFAGQPGGPGDQPGFVDSYNLSLTNDMEPVSATECGYTRRGDRGQLPRCNTGWGFRPLNLLAAAVAIYRGGGGGLVRVSPIRQRVTGTVTAAWEAMGAAANATFRVSVAGGGSVQTAPGGRSAVVSVAGLAAGQHVLTVSAVGVWAPSPISVDHVDPLSAAGTLPAASATTFTIA